VDNRSDIRDFLASRRARITPEQAGLLPGGGRRRVPGLRREEVAVLAGVSTEWYTRLEKGHITGVSEDVLEAVARALQLDEAERTYLFDLARAAARPTRTPQRRGKAQIQPRVQWMLDSMTASAAFVANGRLDIVAANSLGRALHSPLFNDLRRPANFARFQFLDRRARDFYPDWEGAANVTVALLRAEAGRHPGDTQLRELVGELSTVSEEFRTRWAAHNVRIHHNGTKGFRHPVVGGLELGYYTLDLPTEDHRGLRLTIYTAEPGSPAEDRSGA
jgi:transcriptional regulator with XRE-family HTH domain